jgi:hypothetical protein
MDNTAHGGRELSDRQIAELMYPTTLQTIKNWRAGRVKPSPVNQARLDAHGIIIVPKRQPSDRRPGRPPKAKRA